MLDQDVEPDLPSIPSIDVGPDFAMATLLADEPRAQALMKLATAGVPRITLRLLDAVSRRWLVRTHNPQLAEIDAIARRIARPGAHFLSVNYEWGCTVHVGPSPDGRSARLARTFDWRTNGLGRCVMAVNVRAAAGSFVTLTWPGFTGVLQAMAPGRFSVALNQAPMRRLGGGLYPLDWAMNKARVWRTAHVMPGQLLRTVCETATGFAQACSLLSTARIAAPAIFSIAGLKPDETCVIERTEDQTHILDGAVCAGNHWQAPRWAGRPRGHDSRGRAAAMHSVGAVDLDPTFPWLTPPVLNELTRLAMVFDAANCEMIARGYEAGRPATRTLVWPANR